MSWIRSANKRIISRKRSSVRFDQNARVAILVTTADIEEHSEAIKKLHDEYHDKVMAIYDKQRADPAGDEQIDQYIAEENALKDEYIAKAQSIEEEVLRDVASRIVANKTDKILIDVELSGVSPSGHIEWSEIFT